MALRIATGCTSDTNIQHLHNETNILPLNAHLKLHSSQLRQKSQHPTHPLHKFTVLTENERHKKQTIFDNNNNYTVNINTKSDLICEDLIQSNLKLIHSHIVSNHLSQRPPNKVLQDQTPSVSPAELRCLCVSYSSSDICVVIHCTVTSLLPVLLFSRWLSHCCVVMTFSVALSRSCLNDIKSVFPTMLFDRKGKILVLRCYSLWFF